MKKLILSLIIMFVSTNIAFASLEDRAKAARAEKLKMAEEMKKSDEAKKVSCDQLKAILLDDDEMTVQRTVAYDLYKVNCDFLSLAKELEIETKNLNWFQ